MFGGCCAPILDGAAATTAEALMRSRYSAFVVGDTAYLLESWHPRTRPEHLELDGALRWTGLEIVATDAGGAGDERGTVEFRAIWQEGRTRGELHERSRFQRFKGAWRYLDGDVE